MINYFFKEQCNIDKYPPLEKPQRLAKKGFQLDIGDLHANTLKLLNMLTRHGFITIPQQDYNAFAALYKKDVKEITQADLDSFNKILDNIFLIKRCKGIEVLLWDGDK